MGNVKSLIACLSGCLVGGARAEVEVNEAARAEAELHTAASEQAEALLDPPEVLADVAVLIVHDPADETGAEQLVEAIQPRLSVPVRTSSLVAEAEQKAKDAEVALLLVSKNLEDNWELIEAVAKVLPNSLVPILIDEVMANTKDWMGVLTWYFSGDLFINFCKPTEDAADDVMREALAAKGRAVGAPGRRSFHAFLSHEWGKDKWVHKMAIELALRLRDHDIDVWLDAQQVSGSIHGSMADGIDSSTVFLVIATKGYMQKINTGDRSDNCLKEFQYAGNKRSDRIVVAALEECMTKPATGWTGRFQLALTRQAPVDLSECSNGTFSDEAIERLANAIRMRIATPEASSDLTPLMRDIYIRLNPWSSEAWAKGMVKKITIGTRNWILDELYDWYDCAKSAVFVLVGDGGVGKSVVMAELCRCGGALHIDEDAELSETDGSTDSRRNSSHGHGPSHRSKRKQLPIHVAAYHFFRHDQATAAAPKEAIVSIAWQLCQTVPGFSNKLNSVKLSNIRDKPLADVFQLILVNPADKLRSDQMRQVVVLDALDECSKSDDVMEKVIRMWKDVMPAWLSLVVSTRPEGEIQRGITNNSLDSKVLQLKAEDNFRDIQNHIRRLLRDMKGITEQKDVASCAKILSERSGGLFLWTSFLPKTLARMHEEKKCGLLTIHDISMKDVIPSGLGGMFKGYFDRLKVKMGGDEAYQLLLAPIVAAREPLSVDQLTVILGLTKKKTKKIVDNARNLLYQGGDGRLALIHKRMADWLLDDDLSGDLGVDIEAGHEALAKYCRLRDDVFSLRHAIFHLVKSCNQTNRAEAFNLLNDFAWVRKVISVGDDEAQRRVTIGNLISDCVKVGIYIAPESDTPRFLSKAVHALSYDPNELASQVMARLGFNPKDSLALQAPDQPWLKPSRVTLTHPCDPLLHVLKGHSRWVMSVAIQGERVVSGSKDGTVRTWNATSGEEQHVFRGHSDSVLSVAIRDNRIVSGSSDETVRIWDATSGEQRLLKGHSWPVTSVAIEGDIIVSGSDDKTVRIWSATSVKEQHVLKGHSQAVSSVAISSDAVVSGSHDNTIRIWNATSGEMQSVLEGHSDWVVSVAIEGNTIVSGSSDGTVRIWDTTSDEERHVLKEGSSKVTSVAIEGNTIVFGTVDRTVCIWDTTLGKKPYVSKGHSGEITSVGIDGDTIVSGSWDHTVRILNATSGEEHHALNGHYDAVTSLAIEGDVIVSGSWDSTVRIWNATSGEERHVLKGHSFGVTSVTIKGDTVVSGSSDGMVRIWNATSGEEKHILKGHSTWVRSVAIEGEIVVSGSNDNTVRVWNATLGEEQCILKGHSDWVRSVAIRGGTIVSASNDRTVRTWNAASGKVQYVLKGHSGPVWSVAIEGDTIISLSLDGTRYWNARKGEECDANEAGASPTPRTNTFVNIENETHVRLDGGVGFTTDDNINCIVRQGNVYVVGDVMGMVHILHAQVRVNVS